MAGVPQRSLLGPLLFNKYINEVNYSVLNMVLKLYANDATGYNSDPLSLALQFMVNKNLYMFSTRFEYNLLSTKNSTTEAMILGSSTYKYDLFVNRMEIKVKPTLKILGVILDRKISYKARISAKLASIYSKTSALNPLTPMSDQDRISPYTINTILTR